MSVFFEPLEGLSSVPAADATQQAVVKTTEGFRVLSLPLLGDFLTAPLREQMQVLESSIPPAVDLAPVTAGLDNHEQRLVSLEQVDSSYQDRLLTLESAPPPVTDLTAVNASLDNHEQRIGALELSPGGTTDLTAVNESLAAHETRLDTLDQTNVGQAQTNTALQNADTALSGRLDAVELSNGEHTTTLQNHETRISALESAGGGGGGGGTGVGWTVITVGQELVPNTNYVASGSLTLPLPATPQIGDSFVVRTYGGASTIVSNGNVIEGVGGGNDMLVPNGSLVTLATVAANTLIVV